MAQEFRVVHESAISGTPAQVFDAVTVGNAGWLWPIDFEPGPGAEGPMGSVVTVWDPPYKYSNRMEGENGFFNQLDYVITEQPDGSCRLHYVHSGVIYQDWDTQYAAVTAHTAFYQHTLGQYVQYFAGRQAAFAEVQGPEASAAPDAFTRLKQALGIADGGAGGHVSVTIAGLGTVAGQVDYLAENFVGVRTADALLRFFGRNAYGSVVGMTLHLFAEGADADAAGAAWSGWLTNLMAGYT